MLRWHRACGQGAPPSFFLLFLVHEFKKKLKNVCLYCASGTNPGTQETSRNMFTNRKNVRYKNTTRGPDSEHQEMSANKKLLVPRIVPDAPVWFLISFYHTFCPR